MQRLLHPVVAHWFRENIGQPSAPQLQGWPAIYRGEHTLIAAPTGSGKTLSAFMICIDRLMRQAFAGQLEQQVQIVYVSPLKALSNDIRRNLEVPLTGIMAEAKQQDISCQPIDVVVRTGDTPASERQRMLRRPPHILVTTPESLYLLLTSEKSRDILRTTQTVIIDEIHALARDKRGSHLMLSIERLEALSGRPLQRIGLSATQRPMERMARFLVGARSRPDGTPDCALVDVGHQRDLDINIEVPVSELGAVCSHEQWDELYESMVALIQSHRTTLIFVNTRRLAERIAHRLTELMGPDAVASHHGSMSKEQRLSTEDRLKRGDLRAVVATASLELGIDIGAVDLVLQIGSPRAIATFLQRIGRSGHALGLTPKGRLLALTRDELLECLALQDAIAHGELDLLQLPVAPLDILAQQIVAIVAAESCSEDELFHLCRRAAPYMELPRERFDAVVSMLSEGLSSRVRTGAHLHRDHVNSHLRARRGARLAALTSGGAIPDLAEYRVVTTEGDMVGSLDEEFAIESSKGDVFLLGNTSWRILFVRGGQVVVQDAQGSAPTVPFWKGEAPGRTFELSRAVSRLRESIADLVVVNDESGEPLDEASWESLTAPAMEYLQSRFRASRWVARQAARYVAAQKLAVGLVPTQTKVVFERFFDETGGMQMVIHAPFGTRINRAWGLAMRKRYCRRFDFELQAQADDNGFVLAVGPHDGFPLDSMFKLVQSHEARNLVEQAILQTPLFPIRWRWNVTRALSVLRFRGGKKVPPHLQRFRSEDLLTAVFPAQTQCFEHKTGDTELPDHPLVQQTMADCLSEPMDFTGWLHVLQDAESGAIEFIAKDVREPSPFSHQLIHANPYAFLDDAPLEERRARAVTTRRGLSMEALRDLGALDPQAIATVRQEAWPTVRDADELHDALLQLVIVREDEALGWSDFFTDLVASRRAYLVLRADERERPFWVAAERVSAVREVYGDAVRFRPEPSLPAALEQSPGWEESWKQLLRGRMECAGPIQPAELAVLLGLPSDRIQGFYAALESEGAVLSGRFTQTEAVEFCDRRLLARIHFLTLDGLRQRIKPVDRTTFYRFLCEHQHVTPATRHDGRAGLVKVLEQLRGFSGSAAAWENEILVTRMLDYQPQLLDELTLSGEWVWQRQIQSVAKDQTARKRTFNKASPLYFAKRLDAAWLADSQSSIDMNSLSANGQAILAALAGGAAFFTDQLGKRAKLLPSQTDEALRELLGVGLVRADGFAAARAFMGKASAKPVPRGAMASPIKMEGMGGRWTEARANEEVATDVERAERWCQLLLQRYGVVCRDLLVRESLAPPWVSLAMIYRRWEARGLVRGGQFVAKLAGEQFALPEVVERLRALRDEPDNGEYLVVSGADPLNLRGILTPGEKLPAVGRNRLVICGGMVLASRAGDELDFGDVQDATKRDMLARAMRLHGFVRHRDPFLRDFGQRPHSASGPKLRPSSSADLRDRLRLIRG